HAEIAVHLLADTVRHLGAQHHARAALVGLELIKGGLELPTLGIQAGELISWRPARLEHCRDETIGPFIASVFGLVVAQDVLDHSDLHPRRAVAAILGSGIHRRQERAVSETP